VQDDHEPLATPGRDNIREVADYLPVLESIAPADRVWSQDASGCEYHPLIESLLDSFRLNHFVQIFDWVQWQPQAEPFLENILLIEQADLETCVRLITLHVRKERFCAGHVGDVIASGHISAILRRLADLSRMDPVS
jgi:hypothetical protein